MQQKHIKVYYVSNYMGIKFDPEKYRNRYELMGLDSSRFYVDTYEANKGRRKSMNRLLKVLRDDVQIHVPQLVHLGRNFPEVLEVVFKMKDKGVTLISDSDLQDFQQGNICQGFEIEPLHRLLKDFKRLQTGPAKATYKRRNRKGGGKPTGIRSKTTEELLKAYALFTEDPPTKSVREIMREFGYNSVSTFYRHMDHIKENLNQ